MGKHCQRGDTDEGELSSIQPMVATTLPPFMAFSLVELNTRKGLVRPRLRLLARMGTRMV